MRTSISRQQPHVQPLPDLALPAKRHTNITSYNHDQLLLGFKTSDAIPFGGPVGITSRRLSQKASEISSRA